MLDSSIHRAGSVVMWSASRYSGVSYRSSTEPSRSQSSSNATWVREKSNSASDPCQTIRI